MELVTQQKNVQVKEELTMGLALKDLECVAHVCSGLKMFFSQLKNL